MYEPPTEKYSRSEKSLSTLTKKFVEMLKSTEVLDLNIVSSFARRRSIIYLILSIQACLALDVNKKRRIYDITNVLEGISLIKKVGKNLYSWTGRRDADSQELDGLLGLKDERKQLQDDEHQLNE